MNDQVHRLVGQYFQLELAPKRCTTVLITKVGGGPINTSNFGALWQGGTDHRLVTCLYDDGLARDLTVDLPSLLALALSGSATDAYDRTWWHV